jgi:acetyl-CoA synthetase
VAVIDDAGQECPRGTPGDVAVHRLDVHGHPDPVFFLGYWRNEAATAPSTPATRPTAGAAPATPR